MCLYQVFQVENWYVQMAFLFLFQALTFYHNWWAQCSRREKIQSLPALWSCTPVLLISLRTLQGKKKMKVMIWQLRRRKHAWGSRSRRTPWSRYPPKHNAWIQCLSLKKGDPSFKSWCQFLITEEQPWSLSKPGLCAEDNHTSARKYLIPILFFEEKWFLFSWKQRKELLV